MKIFLFTNQFPYGSGEVFLEDELRFGKEKNQIYLCPIESEKSNENIIRTYNNDIYIQNLRDIKFTRKMLITCIEDIMCCKPFLGELKLLINEKNIHFVTLKKVIIAWIRANIIKERILQFVNHKREIDESVVCYSYWASHTAIALSLIKEKRIKTLTRLHGIDLYEERHKYQYLPFRNLIYHNIDMVCSISDEGKRYIQKKYASLHIKDKCVVSRLGTKDYGINPYNSINKELIIVSCSSVIEIKRVHLIFETLKKFQGINIRWIHFGDGQLLEDIKKREKVLDKGIYLKCVFMGYKDKEYIMGYYKSHHIDLFVNVSYSEGIPVSIMEAMSFGIPVVATNVGGVNEIVENGKNGWLIHRDKVIGELENILKIYLRMEEKDRMNIRLYAREKWKRNFAANDNYRKFYELIEEYV